MRDFLSYLGILVVVFLNVTGLVGCAATNQEPTTPQPIAERFVEVPAPTPTDTATAQKNLSEAWSVYWRTQYARAKAEMCKP